MTESPDDLERAIRFHVLAVLKLSLGNQCEAARRLGIHRTTLARMLRRWGQTPRVVSDGDEAT